MAESLSVIRSNISQLVGAPVELTCRARRKESIKQGVLEGAYGALFTVRVAADGRDMRVSYTYTDVLTNAVSVRGR